MRRDYFVLESAAEQVLGIHGLGFRRYSEALGEDSDLTKLVAECLSTGRIYRREEVEHIPRREIRGIWRDDFADPARQRESISGAICLLTD